MKSSFIQPPLFALKRDIAQIEGKWYFNNVYGTYFCFCKGESCISLTIFHIYISQSCKYFFYISIIDRNRNIYPKRHYLLSDFFAENIESADALPIFEEMKKIKLKAHYLTMSQDIYKLLCLNNNNCIKKFEIIYGVTRINGDFLEKYLELILRLKVVVAAEKYDSFDNFFYNVEYITYIFLGHGVTFIKSYLYLDYLSPKKFNKILLPKEKRFIDLAVDSGWKVEDIIKIGYPKWDNYIIQNNQISLNKNNNKTERNIFLMFTWRQVKKEKKISHLYYENIYKLLNSKKINEQLEKYNIKFFFCYHHSVKEKKKIIVNKNTKFIEQTDISSILKNSSLIITDFSSILFDAMVQKKPLILFIPDGSDPNLKDIYARNTYETINNIKNENIYLYEVFLDINEVENKIIYYIKNNFIVEEQKMKFYKSFKLKNKDNTRRFIKYIRMLK